MQPFLNYLPFIIKGLLLTLVVFVILTLIPLPLPKYRLTLAVLVVYILVEGLDVLMFKYQQVVCNSSEDALKKELAKRLEL